jgi:ABC-2 type transport system permease protein
LRAFLAQFKRELSGLFLSPYVFLLLGAWYLLNGFFFSYLLRTPAIQNDLTLLPPYLFGNGLLVWLLLPAFPPLLALRLLAEEQRVGTLEPLLTAPVRDAAVVLAKYLAACVFFLLFWGGVMALFLILSWHGAELDWGRVCAGFTGAALVSFLFLATGLWASSWSGNLVLAAGGGAAINFVLLFVPALLLDAPGKIGALARGAHLPDFLDRAFAAGILDSYAVAFLLILSALFLFLTWLRLTSRRLFA